MKYVQCQRVAGLQGLHHYWEEFKTTRSTQIAQELLDASPREWSIAVASGQARKDLTEFCATLIGAAWVSNYCSSNNCANIREYCPSAFISSSR